MLVVVVEGGVLDLEEVHRDAFDLLVESERLRLYREGSPHQDG
jgi:hypothetical protein